MKKIRNVLLSSLTAASIVSLAELETSAQPFTSGSDGTYGAISVTSGTTNIDIPPNGVFNCTTINVANGATLRFNRNPLNTPIYLLATGDVTITGTIDISGGTYSSGTPGVGGPGGFDGGYGGFGVGANTKGGDGQGPGGGISQNNGYYSQNPLGAAYATPALSGKTYGNALLSPLIGGSGGAGWDGNPGSGGGGGGGAILVASNTKITVTGQVSANGGNGAGGGSGGAIRLVSPLVTGSGSLNASGGGGTFGSAYGTSGSSGRIRIDCQDAYSFRALTMNGVATRGSQMFVFFTPLTRLDILQAAGQTIPEGTNSAVVINLPAGSPTNQTVTVQARNFTNNVPISISVVPENRPSSNYLATITMTTNPSQITVNVVIPDGTISRISAWTH